MLFLPGTYCSVSHAYGNTGIKPNSGIREGYEVRREFSGWCFVMRRDYWKDNLFDERLVFWASDNAICETLKKNKAKHILVTSSIVTHIGNGSNTLFTLPKEKQQEYMHSQVKLFNKLYSTNLWGMGV